jgi:hypothetical protein
MDNQPEEVSMSNGGWAMAAVTAGAIAILAILMWSMARSIQDKRSPNRSVWREFGLSIILLGLFLSAWIGQGLSQWQTFTDEQRSHGEEPELGDFVSEFATSTLENWQSEFLQLFAFVVLASLYIHKGSSESKDSEEKIEASLRRIEASLGTRPSKPAGAKTEWELPETPLEVEDARSS